MIRVKFFAKDQVTPDMIKSSYILFEDDVGLAEKIEAQRQVLERALPTYTILTLVESVENV